MISTETVIVLGAGASIPYQRATTADLLRRSLELEDRRQEQVRWPICLAVQCEDYEVLRFLADLRRSRVRSIDTFLEKRAANERTQFIGRALIARALTMDTELLEPPQTIDWVGYALEKLHAGAKTYDQFAKDCRVYFLTFNFDRSLESILESAIRGIYPEVHEAAVSSFIKHHVIHLHGTLPPYKNQSAGQDPDWLRAAVNAIRVVHDPNDDRVLRNASLLLDSADVICFLGFGYHQENLRKLGFSREGVKNIDASIYCSAYQMGAGEVEDVKRHLNPNNVNERREFGSKDEDCLQFLREHHVLRTD